MKEGVMGVCAAVYNESHGYRTYVHVIVRLFHSTSIKTNQHAEKLSAC